MTDDDRQIHAMLGRALREIGEVKAEIGITRAEVGSMRAEMSLARERAEKAIDDHLRCAAKCATRDKALEDVRRIVADSTQAAAWGAPARNQALSPTEITGPHNLALLEAEHRELVESRKWWRQETAKWIAAIVAALLVAAVSGCTTYVVSHLK